MSMRVRKMYDKKGSLLYYRVRKGKRQYLKDSLIRRMMGELDEYFLSRVEIPSMRQGKGQAIETLISEEALLLASARAASLSRGG